MVIADESSNTATDCIYTNTVNADSISGYGSLRAETMIDGNKGVGLRAVHFIAEGSMLGLRTQPSGSTVAM
jgi:hypothetical protein